MTPTRSPPLPAPGVDSTATYAGGVANLAPTSPSVTGTPLSGTPAERSYDQYQAGKEAEFATALAAAAPGATVDRSLRAVYGGHDRGAGPGAGAQEVAWVT